MYQDFYAADRWTKKQVHCIYQALIVAIATRHADAVDIKFLVDGRPVWVALPHPAWVEYKKQTGRSITDSQDRKSTRLNSSHTVISYAVFCLKKKKKKKNKRQ